jgi:hypothetical protein
MFHPAHPFERCWMPVEGRGECGCTVGVRKPLSSRGQSCPAGTSSWGVTAATVRSRRAHAEIRSQWPLGRNLDASGAAAHATTLDPNMARAPAMGRMKHRPGLAARTAWIGIESAGHDLELGRLGGCFVHRF